MSKLLPQHLTHIRAAGYSTRTITARENVLTAADRALPDGLDTPTTDELAAWLATPTWSGWTRATYYHHLTGFYRWAATGHNPHISWDPSADLTPPKNPSDTPHPVTDAELLQALARSDDRWKLIISLAAYAGLRAAEICRQDRKEINEERVLILRGKGDKTATVPTHPEIWRLIQDRPPGLLVPGIRIARMTPKLLSSKARYHFDSINMPDVHLHRFRHWYATALLRNGTDIRTLQSLMRHASLQTTARYLEIADEQRRFAVSTLPVPSSPQQDAA